MTCINREGETPAEPTAAQVRAAAAQLELRPPSFALPAPRWVRLTMTCINREGEAPAEPALITD